MVGGGVNVADVMSQLATQLDTISGLRVSDHVPKSISPPAAVVALPTSYDYDGTFARGMDRLSLSIHLLVGQVVSRTATQKLAGYMNGSGASSVKQVLEAGTYTAFDSLRVQSVTVGTITVEGVEFLGAIFVVDVVGQGA